MPAISLFFNASVVFPPRTSFMLATATEMVKNIHDNKYITISIIKSQETVTVP
jgi:pantoate kinase